MIWFPVGIISTMCPNFKNTSMETVEDWIPLHLLQLLND